MKKIIIMAIIALFASISLNAAKLTLIYNACGYEYISLQFKVDTTITDTCYYAPIAKGQKDL